MWKAREQQLTYLSRLAKQVLCITASSVPSERLFSSAGNLVHEKRFCLSPETVASFPGSHAWAGRTEPGTHCLRMLSFPRISGNLEISRKTCSVTLTSVRTPTSLV